MNAARRRSSARQPTPTGVLVHALEHPRYEVLPLPGITDGVWRTFLRP
jgi:hypothetical protein